MAINQASFFLYPPRHGPTVEDGELKSVSGEPVKMIDSELIDRSAPKVLNSDVHAWFCERGFQEKENYSGMSVIFRGRETTFLSSQEVVETSIMLDEDEFKELYIRFLLTEKTPERILGWCELIHELGHDFDLKVMDSSDNSLLPCIDFRTLLLQNTNFRMCQKGFEWSLDERR